MNIEKKYPSVVDMEVAARRNIPGFMLDYLVGGLGSGANVQRNRQDLNDVLLTPRYLSAAGNPDIRCRLLGREYDAPFGVAPLGLSGLVWPRSEYILAAAAKAHNIPYTLSTVATVTLEDIRPVAGENGWFQLYPPNDPVVEKSLLDRCSAAGYETILLTVDVQVATRREHDIRNGLAVPPRFDAKTLFQMVTANPAKAFRIYDKTGTLEAGKRADVLILKARHDDPYENLAQAKMDDIEFLSIDGRPVYADERFWELMPGPKHEEVKVGRRMMRVKGSPLSLYRSVRKAVGFDKKLDYLPFEC